MSIFRTSDWDKIGKWAFNSGRGRVIEDSSGSTPIRETGNLYAMGKLFDWAFEHIRREGRGVRDAPLTLFAAVVVCTCIVWLVLSWRYEAIIAQKDARIETLSKQYDLLQENERQRSQHAAVAAPSPEGQSPIKLLYETRELSSANVRGLHETRVILRPDRPVARAAIRITCDGKIESGRFDVTGESVLLDSGSGVDETGSGFVIQFRLPGTGVLDRWW